MDTDDSRSVSATATATDSSTPPSPPLDSTALAMTNEALQKKQTIAKVLKRAHLAKATRMLQQRLALASFKAGRGWAHITLDVIEPHLAQEVEQARKRKAAALANDAADAADQRAASQTAASKKSRAGGHSRRESVQNPYPPLMSLYDTLMNEGNDALYGSVSPTPPQGLHPSSSSLLHTVAVVPSTASALAQLQQPALSQQSSCSSSSSSGAALATVLHPPASPPVSSARSAPPPSEPPPHKRSRASPLAPVAESGDTRDSAVAAAGSMSRRSNNRTPPTAPRAGAAASLASSLHHRRTGSVPLLPSSYHHVTFADQHPQPESPRKLSTSDPQFSATEFVDAATALTSFTRAPSEAGLHSFHSPPAPTANAGVDPAIAAVYESPSPRTPGGSRPRSNTTPQSGAGEGIVDVGDRESAAELMLFLAASPSPGQAKRTVDRPPGATPARRLFEDSLATSALSQRTSGAAVSTGSMPFATRAPTTTLTPSARLGQAFELDGFGTATSPPPPRPLSAGLGAYGQGFSSGW